MRIRHNRRDVLFIACAGMTGLLGLLSPRSAFSGSPSPSPRRVMAEPVSEGARSVLREESAPPQRPTAVAPTLETDAAPTVDSTRGVTPRSRPAPTLDEINPEGVEPPITIETTTFNGIKPGGSAADLSSWGDPTQVRPRKVGEKTGEVRSYNVKDFKRADVTVVEDNVASIVVYFSSAYPPATVIKQLNLAHIKPVTVFDDRGASIGLSFPERGVTFTYAKDKSTPMVTQILLEPIDPVPFVLRAEANIFLRPSTAFLDLNQALRLEAKLDHAHWLKAELLLSIGRYHDALRSADEAIALDGDNLDYQLTRGQILDAKGDHDQAAEVLKQVASHAENSPSTKAQAKRLLGNCLSKGPQPDYKSALDAHVESIKLAEGLLHAENVVARRGAKQILAESYLATSYDIAWGNWQQKAKVVPKWLEKASAAIEDVVTKESGDPEMRLYYFRHALSACAGHPLEFMPDELVKKTIGNAQQLLAATNDPWRKQRIEWETGLALADACQIALAKKENAKGNDLAKQAIEYLERGGRNRQVSREEELTLGKLYYRLGSISAIQKNDHGAAMKLYEKALPLLDREPSELKPSDVGNIGESLVSIGVSQWEIGRKEDALRLTIKGAQWMSQAVDSGKLPSTALSVPYGNLSSMHKALGNLRQAAEFAELAADNSPKNTPQRK